MSFNKRIKGGDIVIEQLDSGDSITFAQAGGVSIVASNALTVTGDLTVTGTTTTVDTVDLNVVDNVIVINSGDAGPGITHPSGLAGIEVDRGVSTNARILFDESDDTWKLDPGTGTPVAITTGGSGLGNIVEDTTPQLGGDLDVNGHSITSAAGGDIVIVADTTGVVKVDQELTLVEQAAPVALAGYSKLYANTAGDGGSGLFYVNNSDSDELVSARKARLYSLIF